jgi:hypothetical protein
VAYSDPDAARPEPGHKFILLFDCAAEERAELAEIRLPALLAQAESFHNLAIPIRVPAIEIVQQPAALVDHHDQSAP